MTVPQGHCQQTQELASTITDGSGRASERAHTLAAAKRLQSGPASPPSSSTDGHNRTTRISGLCVWIQRRSEINAQIFIFLLRRRDADTDQALITRWERGSRSAVGVISPRGCRRSYSPDKRAALFKSDLMTPTRSYRWM